ncbi:MAG: hypothetical protein ACREDR_29960, partial [Blastocatellia bacterium]
MPTAVREGPPTTRTPTKMAIPFYSLFPHSPIKTLTAKIASWIGRRQATTTPKKIPGESTEIGTSASSSPRIDEYLRIRTDRYERRQIIVDVRQMLAQNPLIAEAASVFVDSAVSKGFAVTVEQTSARGVNAGNQRKAQRAIDRVIRECDMRNKVPSWGRMLLAEGDLFLQNIEHPAARELTNIKRMPAAAMERMTDETDSFTDPLNAFRQVDTTSNESVASFALWQITHARWNFIDGERYGNSQYLELRGMEPEFRIMLRDMAIRRHTRGPLRLFHQVGTPEHPGTDSDIQDYMRWNNLTDLEKNGRLTPRMDFFGNGNTSVTAIQGDAKLGEIADVEFILNCLFPRTGLAKGLIGFGETVARDVLDEQREFMFTKQDLLIDVLEWMAIRPSLDMGLLMQGIDPDSIVYAVQFEERMTESGKLAKLEALLEVYEAGLMTKEQFVERASVY